MNGLETNGCQGFLIKLFTRLPPSLVETTLNFSSQSICLKKKVWSIFLVGHFIVGVMIIKTDFDYLRIDSSNSKGFKHITSLQIYKVK
jgi:hypothetical protein